MDIVLQGSEIWSVLSVYMDIVLQRSEIWSVLCVYMDIVLQRSEIRSVLCIHSRTSHKFIITWSSFYSLARYCEMNVCFRSISHCWGVCMCLFSFSFSSFRFSFLFVFLFASPVKAALFPLWCFVLTSVFIREILDLTKNWSCDIYLD